MRKRVLFIVQGEGRGHMTQALALAQTLQQNDYEICAVLVGISGERELPAYFIQAMPVSVQAFRSPSFVTRNNRGVRPLPTFTHNVMKLGEWRKSIDLIDRTIKSQQPDLILNFYEPIAGLYHRMRNPQVPMICIAHQYLADHKNFRFPPGKTIDRQFLKTWSKLTSSGAALKLALSFYPEEEDLKNGVAVVPPLLRRDVFEQPISNEGFFLVYLANRGYREDIIAWHKQYPGVKLHCFMEGNDFDDEHFVHSNLCLHRLNDKKFLSMMARARGLVSTAGFEAICEAFYLGKPSLMVPVEGHFEQYCNAIDAHRAGAGIYDRRFNIEKLLAWSENNPLSESGFRGWVDQAGALILKAIDSVMLNRKAA